MKKILIITWVIFSCIISAETFAQTTIEDPDLKLSIEELKKKYPISLLDEKKKNYKEGQKINIDDYSNAEIKAAFLNADRNFVSRKTIKGKTIKTANGKSLITSEVIVRNQQEDSIILATCESLMKKEKDWFNLDEKWQEIMHSVFDNQLLYAYIYQYLSPEVQICVLDINTLRGI